MSTPAPAASAAPDRWVDATLADFANHLRPVLLSAYHGKRRVTPTLEHRADGSEVFTVHVAPPVAPDGILVVQNGQTLFRRNNEPNP